MRKECKKEMLTPWESMIDIAQVLEVAKIQAGRLLINRVMARERGEHSLSIGLREILFDGIEESLDMLGSHLEDIEVRDKPVPDNVTSIREDR
jgi:hypothetical protein